jgi:hypothetical protein
MSKPSLAQIPPLDKHRHHHPLLQVRDQTGRLHQRRRTSMASLKHTTEIGPYQPQTPETQTETETKTMTTTTISDPPSPTQETRSPEVPRESPGIPRGSSIPPHQGGERHASSAGGASVPATKERPRSGRSVSSGKLVKSQRPKVQYEKAINPIWGWARLGSSRSASTA